MNKETVELLNQVAADRLTKCLAEGSDEKSFEEAMAAVDKQIQLDKLEQDKKNEVRAKIIKGVEIGTAVLVVPFIDFVIKHKYAELICDFEKDYTFTTTAGRSLSSLFKFKK